MRADQRWKGFFVAGALVATLPILAGQSRDALADRIEAITARPAFKHAIFGIEFYDLDANAVVYEQNSDRFFVPGSTTKLVTMGSALQLLGADYRFHTRIYRTGEVASDGTLRGDLVLVAGGDPNLSGRLRPGDTLAFENVDHGYGGPDSHGVDGDPLTVVRRLADAVASRGIKRIDGRVIVDASLYGEGERDGGTGFVVSPIMINDNAVDVVVRAAADGAPAVLGISPKTSYVTFINDIVTAPAVGEAKFRVASDVSGGDGSHTVTLSGTIPAGGRPIMSAYRVPEPARFAEIVLAEALHEHGIAAAARRYEDKRDFADLAKLYSDDRMVADHLSPPLSEEVKVTLKVSQNLHATATPFLIGALVAHKGTDAAGFAEMNKFLATTGADVSGASQSDGAGADAHFTPAFMVGYLAYLAKQSAAAVFHDALPVLGKDGTLWNIQTGSPAAGHVYAKTGTFQVRDLLHDQTMVTGKGLAGYLTTAAGRRLAFAIYANNVEVKDGAAVTPIVGDALGAIAAAAYDAKIERPKKSESAAAAQQAREPATMAPEGTPISLGLAGYAKVLCSAVFVSGRDAAEAFRNSGYMLFPEEHLSAVTYAVDRDKKLVRMTHGTVTRTAKFYGDQGCIIHPENHDGIFFTPVAVKTRLPDASLQPWPMGDKDSGGPLPTELDRARVDKAVDAAFADPAALTAAFVVVYKGRIVAERYMPGITKDTQLESWSMGKSLTATLFALLVKDGVYRIDDPAPVPEWQKPGDPRAQIRIVDLLHMSSGLRFIAGQDPDYTPDKGYPDHALVYTGGIDAFKHSITRPLQFPPNTEGRYRNSDPLTIGWLIKQAVTKRGEEYLTFPQRALFDRIGIRRQVLETDPYGNFLLTGYDYGTARNWARLGLLYLQDGMWQGQRLLPEGWTKFVSTPAPAWKKPVYGGLFWVNGDGAWPVPKTAYFANGAGGQRTVIIPSHDLVVVRMGHYRGDRAGMKALQNALAELMQAVPPTRPDVVSAFRRTSP